MSFGARDTKEIFPPRWDAMRRSRLNAIAMGWGVLYGVFFRVLVGFHIQSLSGSITGVITLSFLVLGPLVMGFLSIYPVERHMRISQARWLFQPWVPVWITCLIFAAIAWEGAICIAMLLPIGMLLASVGGVFGGLAARAFKLRNRTVVCFAALPLLLAPAETLLRRPTAIRTVENTVVIRADAATVWQNIQSVPAIAPAELQPTWTHALGFPRPIAAELSRSGVGGVRKASFEHGLVFYETVTRWQPSRELSFDIKADTTHIPPATLDEHVTIGGPYFDVLDGRYSIEPQTNGSVLLRLTSHQRLTTDVNAYASMWTDAIMSDLQNSILQVIKNRCQLRRQHVL